MVEAVLIENGQGAVKDDLWLTQEERAAIVEILCETKRVLPDDWKAR